MKLIKINLLIFYFLSTCLLFSSENKIRIQIKQGASTYAIAKMLKQNKIIRSEHFFVLLVRFEKATKQLKTGIYEFPPNTSTFSVIKQLKKGEGILTKIVIPEGFSKTEIAARLAANGLGDENKFLEIINQKNLEGYLFPDTYYFSETWSEEKILAEMQKTFEINTAALLKNVTNKKELIIMASIIEKEAKLPSERPFISSVFYNRLKRGKYLESCATIQYALGARKERIFYDDLNIKSPYNTYRKKGLPPTPICSPGIDSIKAALNPANTNYLFFVKKKTNDGSHVFSKTFNEHVRAKNE